MATTSSARSSFRGDIQGLRAIAVLGVLLWHAGVTVVPGGFVGVDVFFVISGFLMTGMLTRDLDRFGRVSLPRFYARRARRLLPAAALALVATALMTVIFLPKIRWRDIGGDIVASATYVINYRLADRATDYLASGLSASPLQHYWSLAVEEQFYIGWPLAIIGVGFLCRRVKARWPLPITVAAATLVSLLWSIHYSPIAPQRAYLVTTTRVWELGIGALISLLPLQLDRVSRHVAAALSWIAIAMIAATMGLLDGRHPFPGKVAMIPVAGAAMLLEVGPAAETAGAGRILVARPLQFVGNISYSLYLWHWPMLVCAGAAFAKPGKSLPVAVGLAVVVCSMLPSWLSWRYVENPLREHVPRDGRLPRWALRLAIQCTVASLLAGVGLAGWVRLTSHHTIVAAALGAEVLGADPLGDPGGIAVDSPGSITPDVALAHDDIPVVYSAGCHVDSPVVQPKGCSFGDAASGVDVVLVGDSHAAQWEPALQALADARHWHLRVFTKSGCPFANAPVTLGNEARGYPECAAWNRAMLDLLAASPPDLVMTSSSRYRLFVDDSVLDEPASDREIVAGYRSTWSALEAIGVPVIVLADTPRPGFDIGDCASASLGHMRRCSFSREEALAASGVPASKATVGTAAELIDLNDAICPDDPCAAVIGNVLVYRDTDHMTATYSSTLSDRIGRALDDLRLP
jgi:peptidoglycan/LPS O-acetylase OafA/YrhL